MRRKTDTEERRELTPEERAHVRGLVRWSGLRKLCKYLSVSESRVKYGLTVEGGCVPVGIIKALLACGTKEAPKRTTPREGAQRARLALGRAWPWTAEEQRIEPSFLGLTRMPAHHRREDLDL